VGSVRTFIQINTFDAISNPAFSATALEASRDVETGGMHVAVVSTNFTLVHICASCGPLLHGITQLTVADEGALGVLTFPKHADV